MIQPTRTRIVVRPDPRETHAGKIIIPEDYQKIPHTGEVVAAGPGGYRKGKWIDQMVKVGERVCWTPAAEDGCYEVGEHVDYEGEKLLMMNDYDLLGVIECA